MGRRLPVSTPLDRPLPFYGTELVQQPSGTLVCGNLRPDASSLLRAATLDSLAQDSMNSLTSGGTPSSPTSSSRQSHVDGLGSGRGPRPKAGAMQVTSPAKN